MTENGLNVLNDWNASNGGIADPLKQFKTHKPFKSL